MLQTVKLTLAIALFFLTVTPQIQAGEAADKTSALYEFLHQFHGHTCGGSLMGARLGLAAKTALEKSGIEGKLKATVFSQSCAVDGVQIFVGTTFGNNAITVQDESDMRLMLTDQKSGREVEARLTNLAMEKGGASRELRQKARGLAEDSPERKKIEQDIEAIFAWFRTAPEADVVTVKTLR